MGSETRGPFCSVPLALEQFEGGKLQFQEEILMWVYMVLSDCEVLRMMKTQKNIKRIYARIILKYINYFSIL